GGGGGGSTSPPPPAPPQQNNVPQGEAELGCINQMFPSIGTIERPSTAPGTIEVGYSHFSTPNPLGGSDWQAYPTHFVSNQTHFVDAFDRNLIIGQNAHLHYNIST